MDLLERLDHIVYKEGLKLKDFFVKSGFSQASYYRVKNGDKSKLQPNEAKKICKAFPLFDYDWLMGNKESASELTISNATIIELAEEGMLGKIMLDNHVKLLETDPTYRLWFEKENNVGALKILKDMRLNK